LKIFSELQKRSLFAVVEKQVPIQFNLWMVEGWAVGHFILSVLALFALPILATSSAIVFIAFYGALRVFEVVIYQINVLFFEWYRKFKKKKHHEARGYLRLILLLLHNYVEIIFWFAFFYLNVPWIFETEALNSPLVSLSFSFYTMTTFGYSIFSPSSSAGYVLTLIQSVIGLFITLMIISRFISYLPKYKTTDRVEQFEETSLCAIDEQYMMETANTTEEARKLVEEGFEYVCTHNETMIFRRPKSEKCARST